MHFSYENAFFLMRSRLSSTLKRPKTLMKTEAFENGFESGAFYKPPFLVWIGENGACFEIDNENSVIHGHFHQRFRACFKADDR